MIAYDLFRLLIIVIAAAVVFLTIRSIVLWYFRLDAILATLERIAATLERTHGRPPSPPSA
jgi:hypothetical protein